MLLATPFRLRNLRATRLAPCPPMRVIEPGKLADLVVLGGDFLTFPENDLDKLRVLMTLMGGQVVHETSGAF